MVRIILTTLVIASLCFGACSSLGSGRWHCPDTGNAIQNGTDLAEFMYNKPFACGDTIILYAGVEYSQPTAYMIDAYIPLKPQTGCTDGQLTTLQSSRIAEIPTGQKEKLVNFRNLMPTLGLTRNAAFRLWDGGSNNYKFSGLRIASTEWAHNNNSSLAMATFNTAGFEFTTDQQIVESRPRNFEIDRMLVEEWEETAYGDANINNTNGDAFFRTISIGIGLGPIQNALVHDSYVKLTGYRRETAWSDITAATETTPTVVTGPSHATFGKSYSSACDTGCSDYCSCVRTVIRGATGKWETLNGPRWLKPRPVDGQWEVAVPDPDFGITYPTYYDGAGKGALTGTVSTAQAGLLTQYAFVSCVGNDVRIIDNHLEAWGMPIFLGGCGNASKDLGTVQAGSTASTVILDHVRDIRVGTIVAFDAPEPWVKSSYCPYGPGYGCYGGWVRAGRVTAINGTTLTLEPWGSDGLDVPPKVGGNAYWKHWDNRDFQIRGNWISRSINHSNAGTGKGAIEMKQCENCLIDGNVIGGYLDGANRVVSNIGNTYFITTRNQSGKTPNIRVHNTRFSNNIASGVRVKDGVSSCAWQMNMNMQDEEHSNSSGSNVWYEHNLHIGCRTFSTAIVTHMPFGGTKSSGYRHNTFAAVMNPTPANFLFMDGGADCTTGPPPMPERVANIDMSIRDNIVSYGAGTWRYNQCWPNASAGLRNNIIIDNGSIGTSTINAAWPGNFPVADYTNFWSGACDVNNWLNCTLKSNNPNKGRASDGSDPGADVLQIQDRIHRWSEKAGILVFSSLGASLNRASWSIGSKAAAVMFQRFTSGNCTVMLYTDATRATLHPDTGDAGRQDCSRTKELVNGDTVQFVFGAMADLTASTTYYYKITDGDRVMVGSFTTGAATTGTNVSVQIADSSATNLMLEYGSGPALGIPGTPATFVGGRAAASFDIPPGSIRYYRWVKRRANSSVIAAGPITAAVR